jgi:hypothetical protein
MLQEIALTPMKNTPLTALSHHIQNQFATWKLAVSLTFLPNSIDVVLYTCTMRFAVWFFSDACENTWPLFLQAEHMQSKISDWTKN